MSQARNAPRTPHAVAAGWIISAIAGLVLVAAMFGLWQLLQAREPSAGPAVPVQRQ